MAEMMSDYIEIGPVPDYTEIKPRLQTEWRWLIAVAFYCCGLGAGTYVISLYYNFIAGMVIGYLISSVVGSLALFFDAGHGFRAWRAATNFRTSWISRGIVFITFFSIFGLLSIVGHLNLLASFSAGGLPVTIADVLTVIFGLAIMFYSGFVMSFSPSISFWNNALVPVIFLVYSFLGGLSLLLLVSSVFPEHGGLDVAFLNRIELGLILLTLFTILVYVVNARDSLPATGLAARRWLGGSAFWIGVIVVGLIIPLIVAAYLSVKGGDPAAVAVGLSICGFLELIGGFIFRAILLNSGYYSPLLSIGRKTV